MRGKKSEMSPSPCLSLSLSPSPSLSLSLSLSLSPSLSPSLSLSPCLSLSPSLSLLSAPTQTPPGISSRGPHRPLVTLRDPPNPLGDATSAVPLSPL